MTSLEKLIKQFEHFPGIGSRQARRFAFHILSLGKDDADELAELIRAVRTNVSVCLSCARFYSKNGSGNTCSICADGARDRSKLAIVERDTDVEAIERSGTFDGLYFVLGGTVPLLDSQDTKKLRGGQLKALIEERSKEGLKEIILAFSVNPDGENTARYVEMLLKDVIAASGTTVTHLGRGLSTGSELEYADPETIKNALKNRS